MVKVKNQEVTSKYALYNGDSCKVIKGIKDDSVGFSIFSPPFASLYSYSDDPADMGNAKSYKEFFVHFSFLVGELQRVMMPGRVIAVHCMDIPTFKSKGEEIGMRDFSGDIVRCFLKHDFIYHSRHCIWKDPLIAATRTKAIGLAHKQIIKDSALCRTGTPDYIVAFRKKGENPKPIKHPKGLTVYHGSRIIPRNLDRFILPKEEAGLIEPSPYEGGKDKRSHWIWQQIASPVWFDIRQSKTLQYKRARESDDERHICPLQIDVVERCLELWSMRGDIVFSPFAGIGTEVYVAVNRGRFGLGVELKSSYWKQSCKNLRMLDKKGFSKDV